MEKVGQIVVSIISGMVSSVYRAFILLCMINWFIPSLNNVITLNIPVMIGISCIWDLFTYSRLRYTHLMASEMEKESKAEERIVNYIIYNIAVPSMVFGVAFMAKQFL